MALRPVHQIDLAVKLIIRNTSFPSLNAQPATQVTSFRLSFTHLNYVRCIISAPTCEATYTNAKQEAGSLFPLC